MKKIAIVGTGIMGHGIASNFLKHGYEVYVWNRTEAKLKDLVKQGAIAVKMPKEAAEKSDLVFEVTANDQSSKKVWLGEDGIIAGSKNGKVVIASATLSTQWIDELNKLCSKKKLHFFDMPLTGGRSGAEEGNLTLLVGGNFKELKKLDKILKAISQKVIYFGKAGSGIRYKLLLNMLQAIHVIGLGEVLKIAEASGLDIKKVGNTLSERPGGTTTNIAWRDYKKELNPINFSIEWITKDLGYAKELAGKINTPLLDTALGKYKRALDSNRGQKDWTAINNEES